MKRFTGPRDDDNVGEARSDVIGLKWPPALFQGLNRFQGVLNDHDEVMRVTVRSFVF